jgi:hypothetical protein
MGNGQWAMGNGQWAMGNGQWAMGNGQWAMGNGNKKKRSRISRQTMPDAPCPMPHSPFPASFGLSNQPIYPLLARLKLYQHGCRPYPSPQNAYPAIENDPQQRGYVLNG